MEGYIGTKPEQRSRYGRTEFEARVRYVTPSKVNDRVVTITGADADRVKLAADVTASVFNQRGFETDPERVIALAILQDIGATGGEDFHTLSSSQVGRLVEFASVLKYRKPRNANGSTGRYFYQLMQRRVAK